MIQNLLQAFYDDSFFIQIVKYYKKCIFWFILNCIIIAIIFLIVFPIIYIYFILFIIYLFLFFFFFLVKIYKVHKNNNFKCKFGIRNVMLEIKARDTYKLKNILENNNFKNKINLIEEYIDFLFNPYKESPKISTFNILFTAFISSLGSLISLYLNQNIYIALAIFLILIFLGCIIAGIYNFFQKEFSNYEIDVYNYIKLILIEIKSLGLK